MDFYDELGALIDVLEHASIDYALCGGVAVTLHGYPRFTRDIDLLIQGESLPRVIELVRGLGFVLESGRIPFDVGKETERELFRISKAEGEELLTLDLLIVCDANRTAWEGRGTIGWKDRSICVVGREGLIQMKRQAGRLQDLLDLEKLESILEDTTGEAR